MPTLVITGASRGIGAQIVREFAKNGWQVLFTYLRSEEKARALEKETGAHAVLCDVRKEEDQAALYQEARRLFPRGVDALICNAGTSSSGLLQDMTAAEWDDLFAVHVRGAFLATKAFLPGMISNRSGCVLYMSSMWGQAGASCEAAYSACKAALIGLGKSMAKEAGPSNVRFNCLCPGVIQTDMLAEYTDGDLQALADETPLGRLGNVEDVAKAAYFLCSQNASFITGQALGVNGGFVV